MAVLCVGTGLTCFLVPFMVETFRHLISAFFSNALNAMIDVITFGAFERSYIVCIIYGSTFWIM